MYADPTSSYNVTSLLGPAAAEALAGSVPAKACDTRSKRLWRNFLHDSYGIGERASRSECERRVDPSESVAARTVHPGIIDTIAGPLVDPHQQVLDAPGIFVCGNAGSPALASGYLAPGSTLGNALITGYLAGTAAASILR